MHGKLKLSITHRQNSRLEYRTGSVSFLFRGKQQPEWHLLAGTSLLLVWAWSSSKWIRGHTCRWYQAHLEIGRTSDSQEMGLLFAFSMAPPCFMLKESKWKGPICQREPTQRGISSPEESLGMPGSACISAFHMKSETGEDREDHKAHESGGQASQDSV